MHRNFSIWFAFHRLKHLAQLPTALRTAATTVSVLSLRLCAHGGPSATPLQGVFATDGPNSVSCPSESWVEYSSTAAPADSQMALVQQNAPLAPLTKEQAGVVTAAAWDLVRTCCLGLHMVRNLCKHCIKSGTWILHRSGT